MDDASLVQAHLSRNLKTGGGFTVAPLVVLSAPPLLQPQFSSRWLNKSYQAFQHQSAEDFLSDERKQTPGIISHSRMDSFTVFLLLCVDTAHFKVA